MHKKVRKLELGRETLRLLEGAQVTPVVGGATATCTQWESCGTTCLTRCSSCCQ